MFFRAVYAIGGLMIIWFAFAMGYPYLTYPLTRGFPLFAPCDFARKPFVALLAILSDPRALDLRLRRRVIL